MESDGPLSGLGWRSLVHPSPSRSAEAHPKDCGDGVRQESGSLTESLMQQYLQQCLDFHESQERQRNCESDPSVRQVQFVKSTGGLNEFFPINESHVAPATGQSTHTAVHVQPSLHAESDPHAFTRSVEEGRSRAQSILDRFHQQQRHLLQLSGGSDSAPDFSVQDHPIAGSSHLLLPQGIPETIQVLHAPSTSAHDATYPSAVLFVEQRTKGLEREAQHKHRFLLRNLDFVARREQERAQILADNIAASKVREAHVQYQYSLALRERQRILRESAIIAQTSTAAIGSQTRRDVERMKRKSFEHGAADMRDNEPHSRSPTSSVSVYLSGLPVDGTVDETFLRRLFEPYASIQKIHLYRDKVSGQLKGDALISYHPSNDADHANLLSDVCSQMNGVELPCGSVMSVEPTYGAIATSVGAKPSKAGKLETTNDLSQQDAEERVVVGEADEDLDDFFNSL